MNEKIFYKGLVYFRTVFYYWINRCVSSYFYPKTIKYVLIYKQETSKSVILTFFIYKDKEYKYMLGYSTLKIPKLNITQSLNNIGIILIEN